jgi:hypothetical protein
VYDFTKKDFDRMYEECLDGEHVATIGVYTISAKKK